MQFWLILLRKMQKHLQVWKMSGKNSMMAWKKHHQFYQKRQIL